MAFSELVDNCCNQRLLFAFSGVNADFWQPRYRDATPPPSLTVSTPGPKISTSGTVSHEPILEDSGSNGIAA